MSLLIIVFRYYLKIKINEIVFLVTTSLIQYIACNETNISVISFIAISHLPLTINSRTFLYQVSKPYTLFHLRFFELGRFLLDDMAQSIGSTL